MSNDLRSTQEHFHGGIDYGDLKTLGKKPEQVLDLSSNILWVQQPNSVRQAIASASVAAYPDRDSEELITRIANQQGIESKRLLAGNGCCELIHLLARSILKPDSRVAVLEPTFTEYRRASELAGAEVVRCWGMPADRSFHWHSELTTRLGNHEFDLVWLCNPNNPTGEARDREQIERLARNHPETLFAIDESYIEFARSARSIADLDLPNLICLRSMTKSHALAGIRLGYLIASEEIVELLRSHRLPWSVSSISQVAGIAALDAQAYYDAAIARMLICRGHLVDELRRRNAQPITSDANFVLVTVGDASQLCRRMLEQQDVLLRDCSSFGLSSFVRIAVSDENGVDRLLDAIDACPKEWSSTNLSERGAALTITHPLKNTKRSSTAEHTSAECKRHLAVSVLSSQRDNQSAWDPDFQKQLYDLFRMRRDIREFRTDALPRKSVERWLDAACMAPSVGLSQPWRFVSVSDATVRDRISREFEQQNSAAANAYGEDRKRHYLSLKLAGIQQAPEQLAVFVVDSPQQGHGLGRQTMPETVEYSVVAAIQNFWLAARSEGVGVGWVSILNSDRVREILGVPGNWRLIAYLCVGYPAGSATQTPSLERDGWEQRTAREQVWTQL